MQNCYQTPSYKTEDFDFPWRLKQFLFLVYLHTVCIRQILSSEQQYILYFLFWFRKVGNLADSHLNKCIEHFKPKAGAEINLDHCSHFIWHWQKLTRRIFVWKGPKLLNSHSPQMFDYLRRDYNMMMYDQFCSQIKPLPKLKN